MSFKQVLVKSKIDKLDEATNEDVVKIEESWILQRVRAEFEVQESKSTEVYYQKTDGRFFEATAVIEKADDVYQTVDIQGDQKTKEMTFGKKSDNKSGDKIKLSGIKRDNAAKELEIKKN